jgi:hypothetical protein
MADEQRGERHRCNLPNEERIALPYSNREQPPGAEPRCVDHDQQSGECGEIEDPAGRMQ